MSAIPVRFGSEDAFRRVRELLKSSEFSEDTVEKRCPDKNNAFIRYPDDRIPADGDAAEILLGLFLRAGACPPAQIESTLGAQALADLRELGMISTNGDGLCQATMRVRPMFGMHMTSDIWDTSSGPNQGLPDDVVFPPDISNTLTYLSYLPLFPCKRFLEGCGGSGIGAILAGSRYAEQAWSFDITERSTAFAAFNAKLNGLDNVTALQGDTFEPAGDMQFDRIAIHPPYVPVLRHTWIYQAGGADGEQITQKHIEGLPKHLAPGGRFYCRALGSDRTDEVFETRVRRWLGSNHHEFDVAIHVMRVVDPFLSVMQAILRGRSKVEDMPAWEKQFTTLKIVRFLAVMLVIQRHEEPRAPFTVRRMRSKYSSPRELEWLLQWETFRSKGLAENHILQSPLKAGAVVLHTHNRPENGAWKLATQTIQVDYPYDCTWEVDPMGAYLLPKLDGAKTGMDIFQSLIEEGAITPDQDPRRFASALSDLISGGFIHVQGFEPPSPRPHEDPEEG
jgi:hypothetical protein